MGDMTIGQIIQFIFEKGVPGVFLVFIGLLALGHLIWKTQHVEVVTILKEKYEAIIIELKAKHDAVVATLKEHHSTIVADLKQQLNAKDKEIDRWQDMALQQKNLVGKSLDAVVSTATEKPVS